jgi:hypothetical protein
MIAGLAWLMVIVITHRCINVLRGMHLEDRKCPGWKFILFGLSYVALAGSSIGAALVISYGNFTLSHIGFLFSSCGLILFDRRRRTHRVRGVKV